MEADGPRLPADPDLEAAQDSAAKPRLVHLSWANIAIVTIGTGLRYVIGLTVPQWDGVPVATVGINVVGAFLLGLLLELLADRSLDTGWSRRIRLGVGTASSAGSPPTARSPPTPPWLAAVHRGRTAGYALGTVLLGAAATIAGIWLARRRLPLAGAQKAGA